MASQLRKLRRATRTPAQQTHAADSITFAGPSDLIVYGVGCAWWDSIDKAGSRPGSVPLPCCPHCGSMLLQTSESDWWRGATKQDAEQPGYLETLRWSQGRCFKTWADAKAAHAADLGGANG